MTSAFDLSGRYATDMFTDEAVELIRTHPKNKPLFLYMSHLAVHAGNNGKFLEAPQDAINRFQHIADPNRRTFAGNNKCTTSFHFPIPSNEQLRKLASKCFMCPLEKSTSKIICTFQLWCTNWTNRWAE